MGQGGKVSRPCSDRGLANGTDPVLALCEAYVAAREAEGVQG